jgi:hypothetical protein
MARRRAQLHAQSDASARSSDRNYIREWAVRKLSGKRRHTQARIGGRACVRAWRLPRPDSARVGGPGRTQSTLPERRGERIYQS